MRFSPNCLHVLLLAVTLVTGKLAAQTVAGTLDTTYGYQGIGALPLYGHSLLATTMELQPDGGAVLAGKSWDSSGRQCMAVSRLLPNGQTDHAFNGGNTFTFTESAENFTARAVAVQPDGKIIVAGDSRTTFYVLRLTAQGARDTSFSLVRISHTAASQVTDVVLQADGTIMLSGNTVRKNFTDLDAEIFSITRWGGTNSAFGSSGKFLYGGVGEQRVTALRVQEDGKLLYAGDLGTSSAYIGRLTAAGVADSTFGSTGGRSFLQVSTTTTHPGVRAMAVEPDGNILVAVTRALEEAEMALMRVNSTGVLDPYFSGDGLLPLTFGGPTWVPTDVLLQGDGRIVLAAHQPEDLGTPSLRLRRYEWNGDVDASFGTAGLATFSSSSLGNLATGLRELSNGDFLFGSATAAGISPRRNAAMRVLRGPASPPAQFSIVAGPQAQTAALGAEVTLTAEVAHPPDQPLACAWFHNNTLIAHTAQPSLTLPQVQASQEGSYHVEISALGIRLRSPPAQLYIQQPPVITHAPTADTVVHFYKMGYIDVRMQGRLPATYQLFRDEVAQSVNYVNSQRTAALSFYGGDSPETHTYRIRITNADGVATSETFRVIKVADPYIAPGDDVLLVAGQPLNLQPLIYTLYDYASNEARITWKMNGKTLPVPATQATYVRNPSRLADAGTYQVGLKHAQGSTQQDFRISIVDIRPRSHIAAAGRKFELPIPTAGPGLTYSWTHQGQPLQARAGLTGVDGPTLTFLSPAPEDAGAYVCTVKMGTLEQGVGEQTLVLATHVPTLAAFTLPVGQIGVPYTAPLPLPAMADHFVIKGLPAGFTYDAIGHTLTGTPAKSGRHTLTLTAINPLGSSAPVKVLLEIAPLAPGLSGRFFGVLQGSFPTQMDVTITPDGVFSGKLTLCPYNGRASRGTFTGRLENGLTVGASSAEYHTTVPLKISGLYHSIGLSELKFIVKPGHLEATLKIPYETEETEGSYRLEGEPTHCPYTAKAPLSPAYTGVFNLGFHEGDSPGGSSYARATVTPAGLVHQVGKLADGTALTTSTPVNANHAFTGLLPLYSHRGYLKYEYTLQPGSQGPDYLNAGISGSYDWFKFALSYTGQTHYPTYFFTTSSTLDVCGKYLAPKHISGLTGPLMMNANPESPYLEVRIHGSRTSATLRSNHSVTFDPSINENPLGVKSLKFSPATGLFTGSGVTRVEEEFYNPRTEYFETRVIQRSFTYQGLVTRPPNDLTSRGVGFALWPVSYIRDDSEKLILLKTSYPVNLAAY